MVSTPRPALLAALVALRVVCAAGRAEEPWAGLVPVAQSFSRLGTGVFFTGYCRVTASRRCLGNGGITDKDTACAFHKSMFQSFHPISRKSFGFCRRFLNRSSEVDSASESCLSSEGTTSDPVTLRRRMLAAAAERRLQKQQIS